MGRSGRMKRALVLAALLVVVASQVASAGCSGWGTVTNVTPYPGGTRFWIAVHADGGYWSSFASVRWFGVGQRVWVGGCPDAARYVERPWVW